MGLVRPHPRYTLRSPPAENTVPWIEDVRGISVPQVAAEIGLEQGRNHSYKPCPSCRVEVRGSNDPRGPIGMTGDAAGWCCHHCGAKGDVIDLVSIWLAGGRLRTVSDDEKTQVREWFEQRGFCNGSNGYESQQKRQALPQLNEPKDSTNVVDEAYVFVKPERPPLDEVRKLWQSAKRITDALQDPEAYSDLLLNFLTDRQFSASLLDQTGVFKVLPPVYETSWPSWWPARWSKNWRLVTPAYEPDGSFGSIHGRALEKVAGQPKTRWPLGHAAGGMFMANRQGVKMRRQKPQELEGLIVCEGFTDLMRASSSVISEELNMAVIAATSGSFKSIGAVKIPPGIPVFISTDPDAAGQRYAEIVKKHLKTHRLYHLPLGE